MLTPVPAPPTRTLSPTAPPCQPCPLPSWWLTTEPTPKASFSIGDCTHAHARCQDVAQAHPSWPTSRVRATVARELAVSTVQLRYLLRKATAAN